MFRFIAVSIWSFRTGDSLCLIVYTREFVQDHRRAKRNGGCLIAKWHWCCFISGLNGIPNFIYDGSNSIGLA
ncbi:Uncharacterized protein HZ326_8275 [Fusarium oxysporum f. sp. albedinis]|nr:Uncharacterized protein HZ326_8275 [Fusarium oxysporum f. sp. albedinis]